MAAGPGAARSSGFIGAPRLRAFLA